MTLEEMLLLQSGMQVPTEVRRPITPPRSMISNRPVGAAYPMTAPTLPSFTAPGQPLLPLMQSRQTTPPVQGPPNLAEMLVPTGPQDLDAMLRGEVLAGEEVNRASAAERQRGFTERATRDMQALIAAGMPPDEAAAEAARVSRGRVTTSQLAPPPVVNTDVEPAPPVNVELSIPAIRDAGQEAAANVPPTLAPTTDPAPEGRAPTPGGGTARTNWPADPDYTRVMEAFAAARPADFQADQQRMWMMGLLGGLANIQFQPGERLGYGLSRAVSGGAQGYAGESVRQEARREGTQREQREYQRSLAGMLAGQEEGRYGRGVQRATFDRDTNFQQQQLDNQRAQIEAARGNRDLQSIMLRLQIAERLRRAGFEEQPATVIADVLPDVVAGRVAPPAGLEVTLPDGRRVPFARARSELDSIVRRSMMRENPAAMTDSVGINRNIDAQLQAVLQAELERMTPEQRARVIQTWQGVRTRSPRQGTPVAGEQ